MLSEFLVRAQQWRDFATAHSRGLRRDFYASTDNADRFASAHSCGLRHKKYTQSRYQSSFATAHSCGLRRPFQQPQFHIGTLPQRIRAGCDWANWAERDCPDLCLSAFARVATFSFFFLPCIAITLPQRIRAGCDPYRRTSTLEEVDFASAHSRGLRRAKAVTLHCRASLPQRIRAGCDCGKAMQRTANLLREGR